MPSAQRINLGTIKGLTKAVQKFYPEKTVKTQIIGEWDGTYCSYCGDFRRMQLSCLRWEPWTNRPQKTVPLAPGDPNVVKNPPNPDRLPSLFAAECVQCKNVLTLVVHKGSRGEELVALPQTYGGFSTPNTPESVAYYLDQAEKAQSVGAFSAAVVMYRSALEHLLHDQGYKKGTLGVRIGELKKDSDPPEWREKIDSDYFGVLNKLGNAAIHVNDGDVKQQAVFEEKLLREVRVLVVELLDEIYEHPHQKKERLDKLQKTASSIKHK